MQAILTSTSSIWSLPINPFETTFKTFMSCIIVTLSSSESPLIMSNWSGVNMKRLLISSMVATPSMFLSTSCITFTAVSIMNVILGISFRSSASKGVISETYNPSSNQSNPSSSSLFLMSNILNMSSEGRGRSVSSVIPSVSLKESTSFLSLSKRESNLRRPPLVVGPVEQSPPSKRASLVMQKRSHSPSPILSEGQPFDGMSSKLIGAQWSSHPGGGMEPGGPQLHAWQAGRRQLTPGRRYRVQRSSSLGSSIWIVVSMQP
mmetsp:Transcript_63595/g.132398  ORF Transcript_63595/g.132398 Transcript_63595/m.132398 type:complete len:262 (+) Transcript_63595:2716-3501(+)